MNAASAATSPHLKHNVIVNLLDGGFFGLALGFASFVTVIPLFVSNLTDSAILIGLIPAIHSVGWQFPQLLLAGRVSRLRRYKPMVLWMTILERLPFLGLAAVAWLLPGLDRNLALTLTYVLLVWQGLGGGLTAGAWQSMIGKIIPSNRRATFYGTQSAIANGLSSLGAIGAGLILGTLDSPLDFTICFLLGGSLLLVSMIFLSLTREPENAPLDPQAAAPPFWKSTTRILGRDRNFRWFLVARMLSQLAAMGFSFYTVHAVENRGLSEVSVGVMTSVLLGIQLAASPFLGWLSDRWSYRACIEIGVAASILSGLLAWWAPSAGWFYLVFALAGIANVAIWTLSLAMILEFGKEEERPAYIGLANTLIAPVTILVPFLGGWLADGYGYPAAFLASVAGGLATLLVLQLAVRDPKALARGNSDFKRVGE